jgi:hypothetical protein
MNPSPADYPVWVNNADIGEIDVSAIDIPDSELHSLAPEESAKSESPVRERQ